MALDNAYFFTESFGWATTGDPSKKWAVGVNVVATGLGRRPGTRYGVTIGAPYYNTILPVQQDFHFHTAFNDVAGIPTFAGKLLSLYDVVGVSLQLELRVNVNGAIYITRNGTQIVAPGPIVWAHTAEWHSVEFLGHIADAPNGWIVVQVDGLPYFDVTGLDTQATANASFGRMYIEVESMNNLIQDIVMRAGAGADKAVDIWGDCKVDYQPVNAAGAYGTWTPQGAATRKECVDEVAGCNYETDYNRETVAGNRDSFSFAALPALAAVKGGVIQAMVRKDEAGARQIKLFSREGGADYDSAAMGLGDTYAAFLRPIPKQNDGSAWDKAAWDAAEAGYKLEV